MGKKIGIDLGTTYSCMSCVDDTGRVRVVHSLEEGDRTPSVVYFDPDISEVFVGTAARRLGVSDFQRMVQRVKNFMGDPCYILSIDGRDYSPAYISSLILQKLISDAECYCFDGEEIDGAVITCPAYFGEAAREATRVAGENVILSNGQKLRVLQILDEPVAAMLAYGVSLHKDFQKTVLIYDLGGGTFDATVMKLNFVGSNRRAEIVASDGDHQLGGADWDQALANYVAEKFCELTGEDPDEMWSDSEQVAEWFSENIEKLKIMLTKRDHAVAEFSYNGRKERIDIIREDFEAETERYLDRTIWIIDDMMTRKGMSIANDIDEIVLIGGATKMPQVERRLQAEYNKPVVSFEPYHAVAMGAALVANGIEVNGIIV